MDTCQSQHVEIATERKLFCSAACPHHRRGFPAAAPWSPLSPCQGFILLWGSQDLSELLAPSDHLLLLPLLLLLVM